MTTVKFDVRSSDPDKAISGGEQPPPGLYKAKIKELKTGYAKGDDGEPDKTRPRLEVVYELVGKKNANFVNLYDYLSFSEAAQWRLDQFLQAVGVASKSKRTGTFKTEQYLGHPVRIRVKGETYNNEYRARVGQVMGGSDEDLEDDDFVGGDDEGVPGDTANEDEGEIANEDTEDPEEPEEDEPEPEEFDREGRQVELKELDIKALREIATGLDIKDRTVRAKKATLVPAILDAEEAAGGEGEEPEEEDLFG